jgi:hypothetical protein
MKCFGVVMSRRDFVSGKIGRNANQPADRGMNQSLVAIDGMKVSGSTMDYSCASEDSYVYPCQKSSEWWEYIPI